MRATTSTGEAPSGLPPDDEEQEITPLGPPVDEDEDGDDAELPGMPADEPDTAG